MDPYVATDILLPTYLLGNNPNLQRKAKFLNWDIEEKNQSVKLEKHVFENQNGSKILTYRTFPVHQD